METTLPPCDTCGRQKEEHKSEDICPGYKPFPWHPGTLEYELAEAKAEIARHHRDMKKISDIAEKKAIRQHEFFKGNKFDQLRVIEPAIFEIRNIVG